jgi:hypothetical protein
VHEIVAVHPSHEPPATQPQAGVQCGDQAVRRLLHELETRIGGGCGAYALGGGVGRAVVDNDTLPSRLSLSLDAAQAGGEGRGCIATAMDAREGLR